MQLDATGAIDEIEEGGAPGVAPSRQPPRDAVGRLRLLAVGEPRMGREHRRDRLNAVELVRKRLDPIGAQAFQLRAPRRQEVRELLLFPAHGGEAT